MAGAGDHHADLRRPRGRGPRRSPAHRVDGGRGGASSTLTRPPRPRWRRRLTHALSSSAPASTVDAVDAALVLLADHELATSTVAVRVADQPRRPLRCHLRRPRPRWVVPSTVAPAGSAPTRCSSRPSGSAPSAPSTRCSGGRGCSSAGHTVYKQGDPRASVLLDRFDAMATADRRRRAGCSAPWWTWRPPTTSRCPTSTSGWRRWWALDFPPDAGHTIFAVARVAGWTAHYLEGDSTNGRCASGPGRSTPPPVQRAPISTAAQADPVGRSDPDHPATSASG